MNKQEVRVIIEETLKSGNKVPGLFDLPKVMGLKTKLESCSSIDEVIAVLEDNRTLVCKAFELSNAHLDAGVEKIKSLVS